ncbi:hypothetical protein DERP_008260 [Dermatophagoides pteronyssinus]|uniref:Uncharacterized protein n=2 Tax=Dermatophagoides pteronyssinus TaxID=6956 RepID=A0ABQ8J5Z5_DERPT|nr:transmembrane protein 267-like [Dermatophagoides pteronyssinus]KAH9418004.1 hypothetical protein DERP_008260 [Dermatophagoides pteronyssinus]
MALIIKLCYLCLYLLIIFFSLLGDYIIALPRPNTLIMYLVAIADTLIHGLHAFLTWFMLILLKIRTSHSLYFCDTKLIVYDILTSSIISILIDFDHVIVAKSFSIHNIHQLTGRPFLHNTAALLIISLLLIHSPIVNDDQQTISYYNRFGWLLLNATIAHHIRDGLRHGLYLYPFPSTNPISLVLCFMIFFLLPIIIHLYSQCINVDFGYLSHSASRMMREISV